MGFYMVSTYAVTTHARTNATLTTFDISNIALIIPINVCGTNSQNMHYFAKSKN